MKKKRAAVFITILFVFILIAGGAIPVGINALFEAEGRGVLKVSWNAADALNYAAVVLGAFFTLLLGCVAVYQNERLHELERRNRIANNSVLLLLHEIILVEDDIQISNIADYKRPAVIQVEAKPNDQVVGHIFKVGVSVLGKGIPTKIRVENCVLSIGEFGEYEISFCECGKNFFSTAIFSGERICFELTVVAKPKEAREIKEYLNQRTGKVVANMLLHIESSDIVYSVKCRSELIRQIGNSDIVWVSNDPMVFFKGVA